MLAIIKSLIYISTYQATPAMPGQSVCEKDLSHLSPQKIVSISVGCHKDRFGKTLMHEEDLRKLYVN